MRCFHGDIRQYEIFRLYVMHIHARQRQHPIYVGKSANMTWHKIDALSKQAVFFQVNLSKTPRA